MLKCNEVQAALSARLDGEPTGLPEDAIDAHVANCAECQAFQQQAIRLQQSLTPVQPVIEADNTPDLSKMILAGVEPQWRQRAASRALGLAITRVLLVLIGICYVIWSVVLLGRTPGEADIRNADGSYSNLLVEAAAFRLALGAGLFFAAWRPRLVAGMLPIVGAMWTFTAGFAARDIVLGVINTSQVVHLGLLLVTVLVLGWSWLNNYGFAAFRHTWDTLSARPTWGPS